MTTHLPPPARASGIGATERLTHRREWRVVHLGFDVVYIAVLVLLAVVSVNTAAASLLDYERVVVTPLRLLESGLPPEAQLFSGVVALAWVALFVGSLMLARAPGHWNLKVYAGLAAVLFALGATLLGGFALLGFALLALYLHGLGRAWYYETMRRHGVVLLFAFAVFALALVLLGTRIPPGFAFGNVVGAEYRDLPLGGPLSLITALLPWWLWALWFMHVVHLARRVTRGNQAPEAGHHTDWKRERAGENRDAKGVTTMAKGLHHRMGSAVGAGALAGLAAAIIMGIAMHAQGMMVNVAQIVGTENLLAGWIYHLFNGAVIGAIFGLVLGRGALNYRQGLLRGGLYGVAWWVIGGLILMPLMLGMPAFAPLRFAEMHGTALFSLVGHIIYGVLLGAGYAWLHVTSPLARRREEPKATQQQ